MKIFFYIFIGLLFVQFGHGQDAKFGVTGGLLHVRADINFDGRKTDARDAGFYLGALVDIEVSEKFHLQPELLYGNVNGGNALMIPFLAKVYLNEKLYIQFGPNIVFSLEEVPDDFSGFEFHGTGGLGFDITNSIGFSARYSLQLNNAYTGDLNIEARGTYFTIGPYYKF